MQERNNKEYKQLLKQGLKYYKNVLRHKKTSSR